MIRNVEIAHPLSQGDIITDVPFFVIPKALTLVLHGEKDRIPCSPSDVGSFRAAKARSESGELKKGLLAIEMPIEIEPGVVITHDCDADNKDIITVAKLTPLATFAVQVKDAIEFDEPLVIFDIIKRMTDGSDYAHLAYVGQPFGEVRMCADLLRAQAFPRKGWYDYLRGNRAKGLNAEGLKYFQGRLSAFSGRFATETGFWHNEADKMLRGEPQN